MAKNTESKKTITRQQYYQLLGLKVLAEEHNKRLEEICDAAVEITKEEEDDFGHTADWTYGSRDTDELLKLLGIVTEKTPSARVKK